jgi:hypothetical protein
MYQVDLAKLDQHLDRLREIIDRLAAKNATTIPSDRERMAQELDTCIQYMQGVLTSDHPTSLAADELTHAYNNIRATVLRTYPDSQSNASARHRFQQMTGTH